MIEDDREWYLLTPAERFRESQRLWDTFLLLGGTCEPQPDSQSPFYFPPEEGEEKRERELDRRYWRPLRAELERWRRERRDV